MAPEWIHCTGLVKLRYPQHECLAGLIQADELDFRALSAELQHGSVERVDCRKIPKVGFAHIDGDFIKRFLEIKGLTESAGRNKENLSVDAVDTLTGTVCPLRLNADQTGDL